MAYAYAVEHMWGDNKNVALFKDRTQALNYAVQKDGQLIELERVWPASNNNPSTPLCMTREADSLPAVKIHIPAPTH